MLIDVLKISRHGCVGIMSSFRRHQKIVLPDHSQITVRSQSDHGQITVSSRARATKFSWQFIVEEYRAKYSNSATVIKSTRTRFIIHKKNTKSLSTTLTFGRCAPSVSVLTSFPKTGRPCVTPVIRTMTLQTASRGGDPPSTARTVSDTSRSPMPALSDSHAFRRSTTVTSCRPVYMQGALRS